MKNSPQDSEKAERRISMSNTFRIIESVKATIGKEGSNDPFEICRRKNINVVYHKLGTLKAYFFCVSRIMNIVINQDADDVAKKVLCAHELGHAILHARLASDNGFHEMNLFDATTPAEYEANLFAAELLIYDEDILDLIRDNSYYEIAQRLSLPSQLVDFKCRIMQSKGYKITPPSISSSSFLKNTQI